MRQRNNLLRVGDESSPEFEAWTQEFCHLSKKVSSTRSRIFSEINSIFTDYISILLPECSIQINFDRGWPNNKSLEEILRSGHQQEKKYRSTRWGPHRANLKIQLNQSNAYLGASRGQQKLIAACLILAQVSHLQKYDSRKCVVLLDDIMAELDAVHTHALFEALQKLKCQIFISTIEPNGMDLGGWSDTKMFHVKHGKCKPSS